MNSIKKAERTKEITGILFKEELGYILDKLDLTHHLPVHKRLRAKRHSKPAPERLRETIEELGPVYIKFGQILSERPDIIPEKYCRELEKLQDSAPSFSHAKARKIVDEEIGLENIDHLEKEPIAAASIAQVHRGKLKTGEEVAVKIKRPGIQKEIETDLDIITSLASKADKLLSIGGNFIQKEAREFARWTKEETDFKNEKRNIKAFKQNMEGEENIRVPEVYEEFCTDKVLTMEYIDAVKCDEVEKIKDMDIDEKEIAEAGIRATLKQILRDGLLHADPHPSNFMVDRDGNLVYLDFGMMTRLTEETRRELGMMMLQISEEDVDGLMKTIEKLSHVEDDADLEKLRDETEHELMKLRNTTIKENSVSRTLIKMTKTAAENGVYLPTKVTLIGKGILTMEGIGMKIYPEFQVQNQYEETVEKMLLQQNKPQDMLKDFTYNLIQNQEVITKLPEKLNQNLEPGIEGKHVHEADFDLEIPWMPIILVASSTLIIAGSAIEQKLLYIGLAELLIGLYLWKG